MKERIPIFVNLYRGSAAIVLGILLFFIPNVSRDLLFNIMGFFWLAIGFTVLRHVQDDEPSPGRRTSIVAGIVGIVTGLLVVARHLLRNWVDSEVIFAILGSVILATGLLHMYSEYRVGAIVWNRRIGAQFLLGLIEVVLGALLLLTPRTNTPLLNIAAVAWAFVYGALYLGVAVGEWIKNRRETKH